jgi:dTDP-glucose 4,6-dehydratase
MTRVLLTGAGGFIGSHALEYLLTATDWDITAIDSPSEPLAHQNRLAWLGHHPERKRVQGFALDLRGLLDMRALGAAGAADYVINLASVTGAGPHRSHLRINVPIAMPVLEYCREAQPRAVIQVSTGEVYGPGGLSGPHPEWSPVVPPSPYAAGKAAQEALAIAYWRSFGVPVIIVNTASLMGERDNPRKLLPVMIRQILAGEEISICAPGGRVPARRWLHPRALVSALVFLLENAPPAAAGLRSRPDRWNIAGPDEITHPALASAVAGFMSQPLRYALEDCTRPGHDTRYGLDASKLAATGWKPPEPFMTSLERAVSWYLANAGWLR